VYHATACVFRKVAALHVSSERLQPSPESLAASQKCSGLLGKPVSLEQLKQIYESVSSLLSQCLRKVAAYLVKLCRDSHNCQCLQKDCSLLSKLGGVSEM